MKVAIIIIFYSGGPGKGRKDKDSLKQLKGRTSQNVASEKHFSLQEVMWILEKKTPYISLSFSTATSQK